MIKDTPFESFRQRPDAPAELKEDSRAKRRLSGTTSLNRLDDSAPFTTLPERLR